MEGFKVYATLLTDAKYLPGLQVLHYTLRKFTARPLIVLLQDNVRVGSQLQAMSGVVVKTVPHIENPHEKKTSASWVGSGYTKLHIWNLTEYSHVLYIDADCLVHASPEDLFSRDVSFAAAPDVFPPDHFNAGVLLIVRSTDPDRLLETVCRGVLRHAIESADSALV